jgi:hypothetical protein
MQDNSKIIDKPRQQHVVISDNKDFTKRFDRHSFDLRPGSEESLKHSSISLGDFNELNVPELQPNQVAVRKRAVRNVRMTPLATNDRLVCEPAQKQTYDPKKDFKRSKTNDF